MKKLLALLVLCASTSFAAGPTRSLIIDIPSSYTGIVTNNGIIWTNAPSVSNLRIAALASSTNYTTTNVVVTVPAEAALCVTIVGTNANFTNVVGFTTQRSYDNITWVAFTNFTMTGNVSTNVTLDKELTFGLYPYFRLQAITNANASTAFGRVELISK